ncbi:MAG: hypothetical protein ACRYFU_16490, partial [Janthinobacterium lividum]
GGVDAAVFLLENGRLVGPERLSTLGVRAVREQTAVGSSLFAQPLMLSAIPEAGSVVATTDSGMAGGGNVVAQAAALSLSPEDRARALIVQLEERAREPGEPEPSERGDALALFRRWYYRPEKSRAGEVLLPNPDGGWPVRRLLNAAARVVLGPPAELPVVDREAAKSGAVQSEAMQNGTMQNGAMQNGAIQNEARQNEAIQNQAKTRVLHPGREGVERVVPVLPKRAKRPGRSKALLPSEIVG